MSDLSSITTKVISNVRDSAGKLAAEDYDRNIAAAIIRYSRHRPNTSVVDIPGTGSSDYSLPAGWINEFSMITKIEYPIGEKPASYLDDDDFEIYRTPTGDQIRLLNDVPTAADSFRVVFTILRTNETVPDGDVDALCNLAAALCLEELANLYPNSSDPSIMADSVNYRSKSQEFSARAKRMMALYKEHLGIKDTDVTPAASAVTALDEKYPGGVERLTHPRRLRERR